VAAQYGWGSGRVPVPPTESEAEQLGGPTGYLSPRAVELDRRWRFYRCTNYAGRRFDWNGQENVEHLEHDFIAHTGNLPPGFYDPAGTTVPLKFRAPSTPFFLGRVIPDRFTSLLFSAKRHPRPEADDPDTEDWLQGFCDATRLWAQMIRVRTHGGAMGTAVVGFKFTRGRPVVEVHDPRWCEPEFEDREQLVLKRLTKLYQFSDIVRNEDGELEQHWFWYRRIIDIETDTVWPKVPVQQNEEPVWKHEACRSVEHGFGECPVVWGQNLPLDDSPDGDPDCHGAFELIGRIDALWSQADRAAINTCDPGIVIASDADLDGIPRGSGRALQLEKGGSAQFLEIGGGGIDKAMELAEKLEEKVCTITRCVLDRNEGGPSRTTEEVEHNYSSMIEQADILREQYGEKVIKRLLEMALRAARKLAESQVEREPGKLPTIVRREVRLPKKRVVDPRTGKTVSWQERQLGRGEQVELVWPDYFTPSGDAVGKAVEAASKAKDSGLIDQEHATGFVAQYFGVENASEVIENIQKEQQSGMLPDPSQVAAARTAAYDQVEARQNLKERGGGR
jgi:hypothetical protein